MLVINDVIFLMQFSQSGLDSLDGFDEFVFGSCVREADAIVVAESVTSHASHMGVVEQEHAEVVAAFDGGFAIGLAVVRLDFREHIESTSRHVAFHAWDFVQHVVEHIAALAECFQHGLDFR